METWKKQESDNKNELLDKIASEYNVLIAGTVGSGKSVLANSIIYNLLLNSPDETRFYFCDPKKVELYSYKDIPHCKGYADDIDSILNLLHDVYNLMEMRYIYTRAENAKKYSGSHIYVIIDELADLMTSPKRKQFIDIITRIMQKSRAAKIHIIACTQSPARLVLPAQIQVNFTCRIALHCMNTIESKQAINKPGAEMLPLYGRGIYLNSAGSTTIDIPFTDDIDIETRVNFWLLQAIERANNKAVADQDINAEKINRLQASRAALNQARQKTNSITETIAAAATGIVNPYITPKAVNVSNDRIIEKELKREKNRLAIGSILLFPLALLKFIAAFIPIGILIYLFW